MVLLSVPMVSVGASVVMTGWTGSGMGVAWKGQLMQQLSVNEASAVFLHILARLMSTHTLGSTSQRSGRGGGKEGDCGRERGG